MLRNLVKTVALSALMAGTALSAYAADYTIRATANSNENDEDYDGLVVFKNYVEAASNGAIEKMQHTLGPHGLFDRFADGRMFSGHTSGAPKPQPGMLQMAMEQAQAARSRAPCFAQVPQSPAWAGQTGSVPVRRQARQRGPAQSIPG